MWRGLLLVALSAGTCLGASCGLDCTVCGANVIWPIPSTTIELDLTDCVLTITQTADAADAEAEATITDSWGLPVELEDGQAVSVNARALLATATGGEYARSVPAADQYAITVNEPSRGVETTTIDTPTFTITSHDDGDGASLSGFTLEWSGADASLEVEITLAQSILGDSKSAEVGPIADAGSHVFDAADLADFQQGADITVEIIKTHTLDAINGFNDGELSVTYSVTIGVTPGP